MMVPVEVLGILSYFVNVYAYLQLLDLHCRRHVGLFSFSLMLP